MSKADSINIYFVTKWNDKRINTFINRNEVKSIEYTSHSGQPTHARQPTYDSVSYNKNFTRSITFGVLNGGGSLVGMDVEVGLGDAFGIQAGAGLVGFGAGLNFHFKPTLRSSFLSFQYWHQGLNDTYTQSLLGPSIVFRARKVFTAQIGIGFVLEKGPAWPESMEQPPAMLTYSIGIYFPQ